MEQGPFLLMRMLYAGRSSEAGIVKHSFQAFHCPVFQAKMERKGLEAFITKECFMHIRTCVLHCEQDLDLWNLDQHCRNKPQDCMFWSGAPSLCLPR